MELRSVLESLPGVFQKKRDQILLEYRVPPFNPLKLTNLKRYIPYLQTSKVNDYLYRVSLDFFHGISTE